VRYTGHVERMGERRGACRILVGRPERKRPLEDLGINGIGRIIFERTLNGLGERDLDLPAS